MEPGRCILSRGPYCAAAVRQYQRAKCSGGKDDMTPMTPYVQSVWCFLFVCQDCVSSCSTTAFPKKQTADCLVPAGDQEVGGGQRQLARDPWLQDFGSQFEFNVKVKSFSLDASCPDSHFYHIIVKVWTAFIDGFSDHFRNHHLDFGALDLVEFPLCCLFQVDLPLAKFGWCGVKIPPAVVYSGENTRLSSTDEHPTPTNHRILATSNTIPSNWHRDSKS